MQKDTEIVCGEIKQGTKISCHLMEDRFEFLEEPRSTDLVKQHSDFIEFPIQWCVEHSMEKEVTDSEEDEEEKEDEEGKSGDDLESHL